MRIRDVVLCFAGALGPLLWLGTAAASPAHADTTDHTIFPPGDLQLVHQEDITGVPSNLWLLMQRQTLLDSYQVTGATNGTFDVQRDHIDYLVNGQIPTLGIGAYNLNWLFPMGHQLHEEVLDATGGATPYDGAVHDLFQWALNLDLQDHPVFAPPLIDYPTFVVFGNEYWETPLGSADYVTILGLTFALFDTFPASADAVDPGTGLADLLAQIG